MLLDKSKLYFSRCSLHVIMLLDKLKFYSSRCVLLFIMLLDKSKSYFSRCVLLAIMLLDKYNQLRIGGISGSIYKSWLFYEIGLHVLFAFQILNALYQIMSVAWM